MKNSNKILEKGLREVFDMKIITNWETVRKQIEATEDYIRYQNLFQAFTEILKHFDDAPLINKIKFKNCDIENGVIGFEVGVYFCLESDDFTISYWLYDDCDYDENYNVIEDRGKYYLTYSLKGEEEIEKEFSQEVLNEVIAKIYEMQANQ